MKQFLPGVRRTYRVFFPKLSRAQIRECIRFLRGRSVRQQNAEIVIKSVCQDLGLSAQEESLLNFGLHILCNLPKEDHAQLTLQKLRRIQSVARAPDIRKQPRVAAALEELAPYSAHLLLREPSPRVGR